MMLVRGLDSIVIDSRPAARGRRMTDQEARGLFGEEILREVEAEGMAYVSTSGSVAGNALRDRRLALGLELDLVARRSKVSVAVLTDIEASRHRSIRDYEHVAQVLGMPTSSLYDGELSASESKLGTRLRTLTLAEGSLGQGSVASLAEIAWIVGTQDRLEKAMEKGPDSFREPVPVSYPAFEHGLELARKFRRDFGLGDAPIESMRALAEDILGITVIHATLQPDIAGATLDVGGRRVIVLNESGPNGKVAVRRATTAHELCHLLYDPEVDLETLRVDKLDNRDYIKENDDVEKRANAFAAELLAPRSVLVSSRDLDSFEDLTNHFGVSVTLMQYQAWNTFSRNGSPFAQRFEPLREQDWEGGEKYTASYSPIVELLDRPMRAGRFAAVIVRAVELGLISEDSAAECLKASSASINQAVERREYADLYDDLWTV